MSNHTFYEEVNHRFNIAKAKFGLSIDVTKSVIIPLLMVARTLDKKTHWNFTVLSEAWEVDGGGRRGRC